MRPDHRKRENDAAECGVSAASGSRGAAEIPDASGSGRAAEIPDAPGSRRAAEIEAASGSGRAAEIADASGSGRAAEISDASGSRRVAAIPDAVRRERAMAVMAGRQCGVVSSRQLHEAGFTDSAIKTRLRAGRLHRVHRGVYLVGHTAAPAHAMEMAGVLACGPGAVVSHRSSARLWSLPSLEAWRTPVEVSVPGRDPGRRAGIRVYRVHSIAARDVRRIGAVPVTSPARTLLDLAAVLPMEALERAVAEARGLGLVRGAELADQLKRNRGRRGSRSLRRLLEIERGQGLTRSEAERRFVALMRDAALPPPRANVWIDRMQVDFLWRAERVIVEVDGYAYHSGTRAFEKDRQRDATLTAKGYTVVRVTWRQLTEGAAGVVARIAAALAVRSADAGESAARL